jgi:RES domain-containing protein
MKDFRIARDLALLDAVDAFAREPFNQPVWRVSRKGRDPLLGAASESRWCNAHFDVLYTSLERDGAISEVHALLSSQPVFPSKIEWYVHRITVQCSRVLRIADTPMLAELGVDISSLKGRDYKRTQQIADAAFFLDFDALLVPNVRWSCHNLVVFTDRIAPSELFVENSETEPVDWSILKDRTLK